MTTQVCDGLAPTLAGNAVSGSLILARINNERSANGEDLLLWNTSLESAALRHSTDMRTNSITLATPMDPA